MRFNYSLFVSVACLATVIYCCFGQSDDFRVLTEHPKLRTKLMEWERQAPEDIQREIYHLRHGGTLQVRLAAARLGEYGEKSKGALLALMEAYPYDYWGTKVVGAIGKIGEAAVDPLLIALKDDNPWGREMAVLALAEIGSKKAVTPLTQLLNDEDSGFRTLTKFALGKLGDKRAVKPLINTYKNCAADDLWGLEVTSWALDTIEPSWRKNKVVDSLVVSLLSNLKKDTSIEENLVITLGLLRNPKALEPLLRMFETNKSSSLKQKIAWALAQYDDPKVFKALINHLVEDQELCCFFAHLILMKSDSVCLQDQAIQKELLDLPPRLQGKNDIMRQAGTCVLRMLEDPKTVEPLIQAIQSTDGNEVMRNMFWPLIIKRKAFESIISLWRNVDCLSEDEAEFSLLILNKFEPTLLQGEVFEKVITNKLTGHISVNTLLKILQRDSNTVAQIISSWANDELDFGDILLFAWQLAATKNKDACVHMVKHIREEAFRDKIIYDPLDALCFEKIVEISGLTSTVEELIGSIDNKRSSDAEVNTSKAEDYIMANILRYLGPNVFTYYSSFDNGGDDVNCSRTVLFYLMKEFPEIVMATLELISAINAAAVIR